MATDNTNMTQPAGNTVVNGVIQAPQFAPEQEAPKESIFGPKGRVTVVSGANLAGEGQDAAMEAAARRNKQNAQPVLDKTAQLVEAALEGGLFQSVKDKATDTWKTWTQTDPNYQPDIDRIMFTGNGKIDRAQARLISENAISREHESELVSRVLGKHEAEQVLGMTDGWGNVIAFTATAADSLPMAVLPGAAVARFSFLGRGARLGLAMGANAGTAVVQELLQASAGMREVNIQDLTRNAALASLFGILDARAAAKPKGAPKDMVGAPKDPLAAPKAEAPADLAGVTKPAESTGFIKGLTTAGRNVMDVATGKWVDELVGKTRTAHAAIKQAAVEGGAVGAGIRASDLEARLAKEFGITDLPAGYLSKMSPEAAADAIHARVLQAIREDLPFAEGVDKTALGAALELEGKTVRGRLEAAADVKDLIDPAPFAKKVTSEVALAKELDELTATVELPEKTLVMQFDNPLDKALYALGHPELTDLHEVALKTLTEALPKVGVQELKDAAARFHADHLSDLVVGLPYEQVATAADKSLLRIHSFADELSLQNAERVRAERAAGANGLSLDDSINGKQLQETIAQVNPDVPVNTTPVVTVDEAGELKGRWDARDVETEPKAWTQAVQTVRAAGKVTKGKVDEWLDAAGLTEHKNAVLMGMQSVGSKSTRLAKRLAANEIYGKLNSQPAKLVLGATFVAGAAAAQDMGAVDNSQEPLMIAGIFIGLKGASRLKGTQHEHILQAHEKATAMEASGMDMEAIRQETGWFVHPADKKWRYEVSTAESFQGDLDKAVKAAAKKMPKVENTKAEEWLQSPDGIDTLAYLGQIVDRSPKTIERYIRTNDTHYLNQLIGLLFQDGQTKKAMSLDTLSRDAEFKQKAKELVDSTPYVTMESLANNSVLTAAYPEFKDIKVYPTKGKEQLGEHDPNKNTIKATTALGKEETRKVLIHEGQHAVQKTEGFARGGSSRSEGSYDKYQRLSGEVEARNAETRRNMTQEDIRMLPPEATQDVPTSEVIVKFRDGSQQAAGVSYSQAQPAKTVEAYPSKDGGVDPQGHLNHGVLRPNLVVAESVVIPETKKLFLSKMDIPIPFVGKKNTRVGWSIADYPGSSESNTARYLQSQMMNSVPGRQAGTATGERVMRNDTGMDVYKKMFMQKHFGVAITESRKLFLEYARANNLGFFKSRYTRDPAQQFFDKVGMVIRGEHTDDPHIQKAAEVFRNVMRDAMQETQKILGGLPKDLPEDSLLGIYRGLKYDERYLPRIWDGRALMEAVSKARDVRDIYRVFADSFQYEDGVRPPMEQRMATAKGIVDLLTALKNDPTIGNIAEMTAEQVTLKGKELGISDEALAAYLSFGGVDAQRYVSGRLQARIKLDELAAPIQIPGKDGGVVELRIADLMVNDPRALMGTWLNMSSGIYGAGIKALDTGFDFTSESLWKTLHQKMVREGATEKEMTYVKEVRNYLLAAGQTTTIMGKESALGQMVRNLVLLKNSTNFVYATPGEFGYNKTLQVFGQNGVLDFVRNLAFLAREGRLDNQLAKDIQTATGAGLEGLTPTVSHMVENNAFNDVGTAVPQLISDKFKLGGFQQVNAYQQGLAQAQALARLVEFARFKAGAASANPLSPADWERVRSFGMDEEMVTQMVPLLNKHAKISEGGGLEGFDFTAMAKEDPVATAKLQGSLFRLAKFSTSDEAGIGEVIPFMTGDMGKFLFQFQAVVARSMQKAKRSALIRDAEELERITLSFMMASLGYIAKIHVVYADQPEEREKRLAEEEIFKAGFRNMALSGPLPAGIDALGSIVFDKAPFADSGNTDRTSRVSIAAVDTWNSAMTTAKRLFGNAGESTFTRQELREIAKWTPLPHYMQPLLGLGGEAAGLIEKDPRPVKAQP